MQSVCGLLLTVLIYWGCKFVYQRFSLIVFTPLVTSLAILVVILTTAHIPYKTYMYSAHWLTDLLGPAIVAFAVPLHKNFHLLKKHAVAIMVSLMAGSAVAICSSVLLAKFVHLGQAVSMSLSPRSVTTPIAMDISEAVGGIPTLTAVFVIITALVGIVIGPLSIRYLRIRSSVGKGALLGMGAHGIGTSKAFEIGQLEGTYASLSMIVAAGLSVALALVMVDVFK